MYVIICTVDQEPVIVSGPFNTFDAARKYELSFDDCIGKHWIRSLTEPCA